MTDDDNQITDDFGNYWDRCSVAGCDIQVVRPGKAQCSGLCDQRDVRWHVNMLRLGLKMVEFALDERSDDDWAFARDQVSGVVVGLADGLADAMEAYAHRDREAPLGSIEPHCGESVALSGMIARLSFPPVVGEPE